MSIGNRIKNKRIEKGMSQDELARLLGYKSRSSINKMENDGRGLPSKKIEAIALALNTTPAYLMGWTDNAQATPVRLDITAAETRHLEKYRQLDADNRIHIDRETDFLLSEQAAAANKKDGQSSA